MRDQHIKEILAVIRSGRSAKVIRERLDDYGPGRGRDILQSGMGHADSYFEAVRDDFCQKFRLTGRNFLCYNI